MGRHDVNEHATPETRAKGGRVKAENAAARKAEAQQIVVERFADKLEDLILGQLRLAGADGESVGAASEAVRLAAIDKALDRVVGRPTQREEVSGPDGGPIEVTDARELLERRIAGIADRRGTEGSA